MIDRIKFFGTTIIYDVEISSNDANTKKITFINNDQPSKNTILLGFEILADNNTVCGRYTDYKYMYADSTTLSTLSSNEYIVTNRKNYIYIENDNTEVVHYDDIVNVKANKIAELSIQCQNQIENGIDIEICGIIEHFSFTITDQLNIKNLFDTVVSTGKSVSWHSNQQDCKMYTPLQIAMIYTRSQCNLMMNTTYFNKLRSYINTFTTDNDIEVINNIYYGVELVGTWKDDYDEIINNMEEVMQTILQRFTEE